MSKQDENHGRISALAELKTWIKLHGITDISMVTDYIDHVTKSITQFPDQPHPSVVQLADGSHAIIVKRLEDQDV